MPGRLPPICRLAPYLRKLSEVVKGCQRYSLFVCVVLVLVLAWRHDLATLICSLEWSWSLVHPGQTNGKQEDVAKIWESEADEAGLMITFWQAFRLIPHEVLKPVKNRPWYQATSFQESGIDSTLPTGRRSMAHHPAATLHCMTDFLDSFWAVCATRLQHQDLQRMLTLQPLACSLLWLAWFTYARIEFVTNHPIFSK